MMKSILLCGLALAAAAPAAASAAERTYQIDREGFRAEYSGRVDEAGILHLSGRDKASGEPFRFTVSKRGYVRGFVGRKAITFSVPEEVRQRAFTQFAASPAS